MAISVKSGSFTLNTTTGNQSITGVGFQPTIVIFFSVFSATNNTTGMRFSFGAMTSAGQFSQETASLGTPTQTGRTSKNTKCITWNDGAGVIIAEAEYVSMDSDGFTINNTTAFTTGARMQYLAFGGSDVSAKIGYFDIPSSTTGTQSVTGVGFAPKCVLFVGGYRDSFGVFADGMGMDLGAMTGTGSEWSMSVRGEDNVTPINAARAQRTNRIIAATNDGASAFTHEYAYSSLDADGFTINRVTANGSSNIRLHYIALGGTAQYKAGSIAQKTSTGTQAYTGIGFQPSALLFAHWASAANTSPTPNTNLNLGSAVSTTDRRAISSTAVDGGSSAYSRTLDEAKALFITGSGSNTHVAAADLSSMDADGYTLNWTTADAEARQIVYLAVGAAAGGGGTTHEAALTLAASGGLSGGASAAFAASIAFSATGGLSDGASADYAAAWSATATAALVPGGAATMLAALALTGSTGLSGAASAGLAAAVAFPVVAGVAAAYGSIVAAALALEAVGGMSAAIQAQYEAAITAATTAGITPAAAAILSASFQAAVVAALAASTGGMDHQATLVLPCSAALSATTYADLAAALTLATGTTVEAGALATMFAGVAFPVLAALAATHPDDIASAVRVVVMFQTASAQIGFTTKSAKVTIQ